jgi:hypothetical protein
MADEVCVGIPSVLKELIDLRVPLYFQGLCGVLIPLFMVQAFRTSLFPRLNFMFFLKKNYRLSVDL